MFTDCVRSPKDKRLRESRDSEHRTNHDRSNSEVSYQSNNSLKITSVSHSSTTELEITIVLSCWPMNDVEVF